MKTPTDGIASTTVSCAARARDRDPSLAQRLPGIVSGDSRLYAAVVSGKLCSNQVQHLQGEDPEHAQAHGPCCLLSQMQDTRERVHLHLELFGTHRKSPSYCAICEALIVKLFLLLENEA